ncbi:MAG TPA: phenylalanine--tRNA ligase subunit alpha [Armatimonadota bacterium]|nr:phenylalanine--tRNA ligase subunit alpha [Armatimonadota bacterium]
MDPLATIQDEAAARVRAAGSLPELEALDIEYLGRKGGKISELMRLIPTLPAEERPGFGQRVNQAKNELTGLLEARRAELRAGETERKLLEEAVDVTRPGRAPELGRRHPLTLTFERVADIMTGLGFQQVDGPEVEEYAYNFAALNFQEEHPALDEQASFYVTENLLLRTQTTALQGRVMPALKPPFRIFTQGRCFRYEAVDATHYHTFHQVDAFMVDRRVTLADLKGTLAAMARELFGPDVTVRFRPDYFPFVEPGVEIAVKLPHRWMELGGAGMIHPNVLRHVGIDPEEWTGFAFGLGLDRMPMVRYDIKDIRLLFENDLRMLRQF